MTDKTPMEIAQIFNNIANENRHVIIPIGFPQSGKSLFLSSIMYYASRGTNVPFNQVRQTQPPYDSGNYAVDRMINEMSQGKLYDRTREGTMDMIGIDIKPREISKKRPSIKTLFLDLAGEDLKTIKTSLGGRLPTHVNSALAGLEYAGNPIFVLVTPYIPVAETTHHDEDTLMSDFINYLKSNNVKLFQKSKFFILITKWDLNPNPHVETPEAFITDKRPQLYNQIKDMVCDYGHYSIGNVLSLQDDDGVTYQSITHIDQNAPERFWRALYQNITGTSIEKTNWWNF